MVWYPNGQAPDAALVEYRGCKASPDMARRVAWTEREYMRANPGGYISPNEIYRDYAAQVYWKQWWTDRGFPGNAAAPGYSNHGDWDIGAVDWDCDDIGLRTDLAAQVGLLRTMLPQETWHYAKRNEGVIDLSGFSWAGGTVTPIEEDDMFNDSDRYAQGLILGAVGRIELSMYTAQKKLDALTAKADLILWATTDKDSGLRKMVANAITLLEQVKSGQDLSADQLKDLGELLEQPKALVAAVDAAGTPDEIETAARVALAAKPSILASLGELVSKGVDPESLKI